MAGWGHATTGPLIPSSTVNTVAALEYVIWLGIVCVCVCVCVDIGLCVDVGVCVTHIAFGESLGCQAYLHRWDLPHYWYHQYCCLERYSSQD